MTSTADPGEIEAKLRAKAEEFVALRDRLNRLTNGDPEVTKLRKAAAAALDQGRFTEADARELSAAVMLSSANTKMLSVVIFDLNESGNLGVIAVLGVTMLIMTFAVVEGFLEALHDAVSAVRHGVLRSRQCRAMAVVKDLKPAISWSV